MSSGYLLADGDVIEIRPYWQFRFKQETLAPEESLNQLQTQESKVQFGDSRQPWLLLMVKAL